MKTKEKGTKGTKVRVPTAEAAAILSALHNLSCPISDNRDTTSPLRMIRSLNKKKQIH